ncbi:MAG: hypothetical protein V1703_01135, partial [Candidatus Altiarchaeota archaeon]
QCNDDVWYNTNQDQYYSGGMSTTTTTTTIATTTTSSAATTTTTAITTTTTLVGVKCWSGQNQYLEQNTNQFSKFCKCAQGTYGYKGTVAAGNKALYRYVDSNDNENWETTAIRGKAVSNVQCNDDVWYNTNQDQYY